MKFIKPFFISAVVALALTSCSPSLAPIIGTNPANIDKTPLNQLQLVKLICLDGVI
jgi:hypothetical protein